MVTLPRRLVLVGLTVSALGCKTNRALRVRLDARLAEYKEPKVDRVLPPDDGIPVPWQAGQFVVISQRHKQDVTLLKITADQVTAQGATLSFVELSEFSTSLVTATFAKRPMDTAEAMAAVQSLQISRGDGELTAYQFGQLEAGDRRRLLLETVQRRWMPILARPVIDARRETVLTKAGRFEGCLGYQGVLPMRNVGDVTLEGWLHPTVPLAPVVMAKSRDGNRALELLDYGFGGPSGGAFL